MLVDHAIINVKAGQGGNGCNSYERSNHLKHPRPHGGDGGKGGDVLLEASKSARTLLDLKMRVNFESASGKHGGSNHKNGAVGEDLIVPVPVGTEVYDEGAGCILADLCKVGDRVVVASGGAGGKGNHRKAESLPGDEGVVRQVRLELKLIADIGLVGFPNAGKSTLISILTKAKSRIAAFPFTTKEPVLGVIQSGYGESMIVADIPGLIEGAHEGRGLGHRFLRHIERTKILVQIVDMGGFDGRDPIEDYRVIRQELADYSPAFKKKPIVLVANKMDIPEAAANLVKFKKKVKGKVFEISAVTGKGLKPLVTDLFHKMGKTDI